MRKTDFYGMNIVSFLYAAAIVIMSAVFLTGCGASDSTESAEDTETEISSGVLHESGDYAASYESGDAAGDESSDACASWLDCTHLIAHAGGGVAEDDGEYTYTNSMEAFCMNYKLGHRVFEFDFLPTTDGDLACTHEWPDDVELSSEEWLSTTVDTEGKYSYTTMVIGDVYDLMLEFPDTYIVTDTKLTDPDDVAAEFQILYEKAAERDISLLDRVVPQIYTDEMYDVIMEVYDWPSIIYTTYKTRKDESVTADDILSFAASKDNIDVITASRKDTRFQDEGVQKVHDAGMLLFVHTIDDMDELVSFEEAGADGFYTNFITPDEFLEECGL